MFELMPSRSGRMALRALPSYCILRRQRSSDYARDGADGILLGLQCCAFPVHVIATSEPPCSVVKSEVSLKPENEET